MSGLITVGLVLYARGLVLLWCDIRGSRLKSGVCIKAWRATCLR